MSGDTFTCARCGGTFDKITSDEEALAERIKLFGTENLDKDAVICHDCWLEFMEWLESKTTHQ